MLRACVCARVLKWRSGSALSSRGYQDVMVEGAAGNDWCGASTAALHCLESQYISTIMAHTDSNVPVCAHTPA